MWMRRTALVIGILFSAFFLLHVVLEVAFVPAEDRVEFPRGMDMVLMLAGPISLILATLVAYKHELAGGWWLVAGGAVTAVLFAIRLSDRPWNYLIIFAVMSLPMLVEGALFVLHDRSTHAH